MNKSDMIDVFACSIEKTIGGMWKHEVGILGGSDRHLNFECDGKEYVLVLTEVTDGHNFSEYLSSAADVREVKHGYWEVVCSEPWAILKCSECGHKRQTERYPKFCEFCGAVMRGVKDK